MQTREAVPETGCAVLKFETDEFGLVTAEGVAKMLGEAPLEAPGAVGSIGYIGRSACGRTFVVEPGSRRRFPKGCPVIALLEETQVPPHIPMQRDGAA